MNYYEEKRFQELKNVMESCLSSIEYENTLIERIERREEENKRPYEKNKKQYEKELKKMNEEYETLKKNYSAKEDKGDVSAIIKLKRSIESKLSLIESTNGLIESKEEEEKKRPHKKEIRKYEQEIEQIREEYEMLKEKYTRMQEGKAERERRYKEALKQEYIKEQLDKKKSLEVFHNASNRSLPNSTVSPESKQKKTTPHPLQKLKSQGPVFHTKFKRLIDGFYGLPEKSTGGKRKTLKRR